MPFSSWKFGPSDTSTTVTNVSSVSKTVRSPIDALLQLIRSFGCKQTSKSKSTVGSRSGQSLPSIDAGQSSAELADLVPSLTFARATEPKPMEIVRSETPHDSSSTESAPREQVPRTIAAPDVFTEDDGADSDDAKQTFAVRRRPLPFRVHWGAISPRATRNR